MARSLASDTLVHAYLLYPSMLLGAQLHKPFLNLTSMLYSALWYVIVVLEVT